MTAEKVAALTPGQHLTIMIPVLIIPNIDILISIFMGL